MARDLKTVPTEELRAEYEPQTAKLRDLRKQMKALEADIEPLKAELVERDNKITLIRNAVMSGQQGLLRAMGVSEEAIKATEAWFAEERARRIASRSGGEAVSQ